MNAEYEEVKILYERLSYLEAYSKHTDLRVSRNPETAVGGMWEEIGLLQFDFIRNQGLKRQHSLLDIGCGTLRGGRHFIAYLQESKYFGTDISEGAIVFSRQLALREGLMDKLPVLHVDEDLSMDFCGLGAPRFDYILAQSVFTHLQEKHVEQVIRNVKLVMSVTSRFFFTFLEHPMYEGVSHKDFYHQRQVFDKFAVQFGFSVKDYTSKYVHPRGHTMLEFTLK